ncbi:MAG: YwaF family protein, partial [Firmicutes bacterium]|nr:YwaF family protein [Candidatus Colimorpha enterica]
AMALTLPAVGFYDCSILLPRMLGYYITHYLVLIGGPMMCLLGFFRPKFKDFPKTLIASFCVLTGVSLINVILRVTKLNPYANYFYSMETEGNPILELLHSLIPYPYFYMLPLIVILVTYMTLVTLPFAIADKKRKAKEKAEEAEAKA